MTDHATNLLTRLVALYDQRKEEDGYFDPLGIESDLMEIAEEARDFLHTSQGICPECLEHRSNCTCPPLFNVLTGQITPAGDLYDPDAEEEEKEEDDCPNRPCPCCNEDGTCERECFVSDE